MKLLALVAIALGACYIIAHVVVSCVQSMAVTASL